MYMYIYGTRSFVATACEGWLLVTPRKVTTNYRKQQERNRIESDEKRWKYLKVRVNEICAEGDAVAKQEISLQEPVRRK